MATSDHATGLAAIRSHHLFAGLSPAQMQRLVAASHVEECESGRLLFDRGGRSVLLAEDNEVNRGLAEELLEMLGFEVHGVANGLEAVQAASRAGYDLILMDCQMPELDGYEATARIRAAEAEAGPDGRRVPIMALTGHALAGEREKCLAAGMDDFLSKPFKLAQLSETLERWLPDSG